MCYQNLNYWLFPPKNLLISRRVGIKYQVYFASQQNKYNVGNNEGGHVIKGLFFSCQFTLKSHEWEQQTSEVLIWTWEDKFHTYKQLCIILFII